MSPAPEARVAASITAGLTDAAVLLDTDLQPISYNPALLLFSGLRRKAFDQQCQDAGDFFDLLGNSNWHRDNVDRCMANGRVMRFDEVGVTSPSGDKYTMIVSYIPVVDVDNRVVGLILCLRDVSAEARMQERYKELVSLERARADELERQVGERTQELATALAEVTRLSRTDPLTGLLNRRAFSEHAEAALLAAERYGRRLAVLMCDLDHFKRVNDTYGHDAGDAVLAATAGCLRDSVRKSDHVARFGGEEFVILLAETTMAGVEQVGRRCNQAVRNREWVEVVSTILEPVTVSVGVAVFPDHGREFAGLLSKADSALYEAKRLGRDRVVVFSEGVESPVVVSDDEDRRRVLLVDPSAERAQEYVSALSPLFDMVVTTAPENASVLCTNESFDVIIAESSLEGDGAVDFLTDSIRVQPDAVRVLILSDRDHFVTLKVRSLSAIDHFLLRADASSYLVSAIQDGLFRRDVTTRPGGEQSMTRDMWSERVYRALTGVLSSGGIHMVYQPIIDSDSGETFGVEALCRCNEPLLENPTTLFKVAVRSGRVWQLSRLVRKAVVNDAGELPTDLRLFVNLDPLDLDDPEFLEGEEYLQEIRSRLVFEITERVTFPDLSRVQSNLNELRKWGYQFAVDDLGAGFAGLNSVALLEPNFIKVNAFLIRGINESNSRGKIVRRIVEFANDAGVRIIAEGIETKEEADVAKGLGCHLLQGYYFARPSRDLVGAPSD
ncbi:EAL domain-containing protein [Myxococcota bacterium]